MPGLRREEVKRGAERPACRAVAIAHERMADELGAEISLAGEFVLVPRGANMYVFHGKDLQFAPLWRGIFLPSRMFVMVTVKHIHQQVNVTEGGQAVVAGDTVTRARGELRRGIIEK